MRAVNSNGHRLDAQLVASYLLAQVSPVVILESSFMLENQCFLACCARIALYVAIPRDANLSGQVTTSKHRSVIQRSVTSINVQQVGAAAM
jgi:hypothetical protein